MEVFQTNKTSKEFIVDEQVEVKPKFWRIVGRSVAITVIVALSVLITVGATFLIVRYNDHTVRIQEQGKRIAVLEDENKKLSEALIKTGPQTLYNAEPLKIVKNAPEVQEEK